MYFIGNKDCLFLDTDRNIATLDFNGDFNMQGKRINIYGGSKMIHVMLKTDLAIYRLVEEFISSKQVLVDTTKAKSYRNSYEQLRKTYYFNGE